MGKNCSNSVLDGLLNVIKDASITTKIAVCTSEPTTFAHATTNNSSASGYMLAITSGLTAASAYTGPATSGSARVLTVVANSGVNIVATASAGHVAIVDSTNSALLYVTTTATTGLTSGGTVNVGSWTITVNKPT